MNKNNFERFFIGDVYVNKDDSGIPFISSDRIGDESLMFKSFYEAYSYLINKYNYSLYDFFKYVNFKWLNGK